jgi:hypothetical protein
VRATGAWTPRSARQQDASLAKDRLRFHRAGIEIRTAMTSSFA